MNDTPILSIFVPTYNHEYYIKRALDSILMQKTEYSYEVLVGEDVSTDSTRDVLKEYERQHPGNISLDLRETIFGLMIRKFRSRWIFWKPTPSILPLPTTV